VAPACVVTAAAHTGVAAHVAANWNHFHDNDAFAGVSRLTCVARMDRGAFHNKRLNVFPVGGLPGSEGLFPIW
jgi:hypothetical protein